MIAAGAFFSRPAPDGRDLGGPEEVDAAAVLDRRCRYPEQPRRGGGVDCLDDAGGHFRLALVDREIDRLVVRVAARNVLVEELERHRSNPVADDKGQAVGDVVGRRNRKRVAFVEAVVGVERAVQDHRIQVIRHPRGVLAGAADLELVVAGRDDRLRRRRREDKVRVGLDLGGHFAALDEPDHDIVQVESLVGVVLAAGDGVELVDKVGRQKILAGQVIRVGQRAGPINWVMDHADHTALDSERRTPAGEHRVERISDDFRHLLGFHHGSDLDRGADERIGTKSVAHGLDRRVGRLLEALGPVEHHAVLVDVGDD